MNKEPKSRIYQDAALYFFDMNKLTYLSSLSHRSTSSFVSGVREWRGLSSFSGAYLSAMRLMLSQAPHSLKNRMVFRIAAIMAIIHKSAYKKVPISNFIKRFQSAKLHILFQTDYVCNYAI